MAVFLFSFYLHINIVRQLKKSLPHTDEKQGFSFKTFPPFPFHKVLLSWRIELFQLHYYYY